MSCFIDLAGAISSTDDSLRSIYVVDVGTTTFQAFALMHLQQGYSDLLEQDVDSAVAAGAKPTPNAAAEAARWNLTYKDDSTKQNSQCGQWENLIESGQTQLSGDSDSRKANFGLAEGIPNTLSLINSLITSFN